MGKASMSLLVATMLGFLVLCGPAWAVEPNLVSHWKFDDGSGTTAYDSAGDNNGTIYGAQWTTGQIDGALSFDGAGDYVNCGSDSSLDITDAITIGAWVKRPNFETHGMIVGKTNGNSVTAGYGLSSYTDGLEFNFYSGGWRRTTPRVTIPANEWHHVVGTFDGNDAYLYVDGEQSASLGYVGTIIPATGHSLHIGYWRPRRPCYFHGSIDEVAIYDRALSAEEIQRIYLKTLAIGNIEQAIDEKEEMLEVIDETLEKEWDAYDALEELLESGDYGDLKKGDIVKAKQKIHSAIQHQEQSADALEKSIEKLEDALSALGWEPPADEVVEE